MTKELLTLHCYFPTILGVAINPNHSTVEDNLTKKCYEIEKKTKCDRREGNMTTSPLSTGRDNA